MWLSDRRTFLAGAAASLAACGFEPVHAPGNRDSALLFRTAIDVPKNQDAYLFARRFEDRVGRAGAAADFRLSVSLSSSQSGSGSVSSGATTRIRVDGRARFALRDTATDLVVVSGETSAFTGYSTTGSTVATLAAERDAVERLMTMLADQVIDSLILAQADLPK